LAAGGAGDFLIEFADSDFAFSPTAMMPSATTPNAVAPATAPAMRRAVARVRDGDNDQDDQADGVKQMELLRGHLSLRLGRPAAESRGLHGCRFITHTCAI
jgi:hypothetical protein